MGIEPWWQNRGTTAFHARGRAFQWTPWNARHHWLCYSRAVSRKCCGRPDSYFLQAAQCCTGAAHECMIACLCDLLDVQMWTWVRLKYINVLYKSIKVK